MLEFIVGIGIPGSGKTTYLKKLAEEHNFSYIGSDDIREEFEKADKADEVKGSKLWQEIKFRIMNELHARNSVVFDATLFKAKYRVELANWARECGAEKVEGIFMDTLKEVALERNRTRERVVPEEAIGIMHAELEKHTPSVTEGFDTIYTIDEHGEIKEVREYPESVLEYDPFKIR